MGREADRNSKQQRVISANESKGGGIYGEENLIVVGLVSALFAIPVHADDRQTTDGQATESHLSAVNMHIGGGIGVPMDPTGNFAGVGGTLQAGAGPNRIFGIPN